MPAFAGSAVGSPGPGVLTFGEFGNATTNTNRFLAVGPYLAPSATESDLRIPTPAAGTVVGMTIGISVAVTAGHTFTATLMVDGSASALAVSFVNADGASVKSATGSVAVTKGQLLSIRIVKDTAGAQTFNSKGGLAVRWS